MRQAAGQIPLRFGREPPPQQIGNHEAEDAVAKEFEPLIAAPRKCPRRVSMAAMTLCRGAIGRDGRAGMGQRLGEQLGTGKGMTDQPLEIRCTRFRRGYLRPHPTPWKSRL